MAGNSSANAPRLRARRRSGPRCCAGRGTAARRRSARRRSRSSIVISPSAVRRRTWSAPISSTSEPRSGRILPRRTSLSRVSRFLALTRLNASPRYESVSSVPGLPGEAHGGLDRAVAAADTEDLLAAVLLGVAHLVHHFRQLLAGGAELARRAAAAERQQNAAGAPGAADGENVEQPAIRDHLQAPSGRRGPRAGASPAGRGRARAALPCCTPTCATGRGCGSSTSSVWVSLRRGKL